MTAKKSATPPNEPESDTRLILRFTPEEAQVAINLFDIAIRARGLEAAEAGLHLSRKFQAAMQGLPT